MGRLAAFARFCSRVALRCQKPAFAELMRMGCAAGVLPGVEDLRDDFVKARAVLDLGEDKRAFAAHFAGVALHYRQVGADRRSKVGFVDDQKSDWVMPGPPLRGILSPPATSIT